MIQVTRLDGSSCFLNAELIVRVEATPDTLLTLANGDKLMVRESCDEIVSRAVAYRAAVAARATAALPHEPAPLEV